ncbi:MULTISPECIES: DUF1266 domain-containing protein [Streptomyces]|uniref:DUF1266 domain-containing protein n=1 Tax=Streptomyces dengpaensis TaxID=2049881 RepID=A0ABN5I9P5_9ACTN|nr:MULTISPECIES: DUF1266 domain-containing protein [Streptomyces]AVH58845.1 DUF1266 domain-containing protein [Streptomyces dengpaensis]PIB11104.1 hypothetical protein B1C81_04415 [Streptomyces sp. HG99]
MAIWNRRKPKATRKYPVPLTMHQLWMVSLSAPVNWDKDASRTTLYPFTRIDDDKAGQWLADKWEITSREALVRRLDGLARTGYRTRALQRLGVEPLAWDAGLYVDLSRRGFACGMLSEAETWTALKNIVPAVVRSYASWNEYAEHYLLGRSVWREGLPGPRDANFPAPQSASDAHLKSLLDPANKSSPWNQAPWDAISHPDHAR